MWCPVHCTGFLGDSNNPNTTGWPDHKCQSVSAVRTQKVPGLRSGPAQRGIWRERAMTWSFLSKLESLLFLDTLFLYIVNIKNINNSSGDLTGISAIKTLLAWTTKHTSKLEAFNKQNSTLYVVEHLDQITGANALPGRSQKTNASPVRCKQWFYYRTILGNATLVSLQSVWSLTFHTVSEQPKLKIKRMRNQREVPHSRTFLWRSSREITNSWWNRRNRKSDLNLKIIVENLSP